MVRTFFITNSHFSDTQINANGSSYQMVFVPKGHFAKVYYSESQNSELSFSEQSIRKVIMIIPEIWNIKTYDSLFE